MIFGLSFFTPASAQVLIKGTVKDNKGRPMQSASIALKDTYDGATSDSSGKFSFKTSEKGEQLLVVTSSGYRPFEQKINLGADNMNFDISLKEDITELKAVTISAGSFEASDRKRAGVVLVSVSNFSLTMTEPCGKLGFLSVSIGWRAISFT